MDICERCEKPCLELDEFFECQSCLENRAEAAYERAQQSDMDGDYLKTEQRLNQQLRDAGRGHLVRR